MRGIIILPGITLGEPQAFSFGALDLQKLRSWVLLWDKIAVPNQNLMVISGDPELDYLEASGVLSRYPVQLTSGEGTAILKDARGQVFEILEAEEPGSWSWHADEAETDQPSETAGRSLRIRLSSALAIPDQDVPLEDVLAFRERRKAEREALHSCIDEVYLSVIASPDRPLAEHVALGKLVSGARDHFEVVRESGFRFRLADIAADFNLVTAGAVAAGLVALGATWPLVVGNSLLAGSTVTVGKIAGLATGKKGNSPYRYLSQIHEEVFSGSE